MLGNQFISWLTESKLVIGTHRIAECLRHFRCKRIERLTRLRCGGQSCQVFAMSSPCHVKCIPKPLPRDPVPNHYDQASTNPRKLKYVDPSHRNCVPGFAAASFTPKDPAEKYRGRTHNCTAAVTANSGERYAICHSQVLTGYKAPYAYGQSAVFDGLTLESGDKRDMKTPKTTHKRFHYLPRSKTGMSNAGIFAEKSAMMHRHQMG
uniref:Uncharacterized protein n=1 Tax=Physcomitrium patens TaxID=3218 RepID=A0A2K1L700_PHYPA|nr:hypothetical protein PHYPA_000244 [Physcomitrium patens]